MEEAFSTTVPRGIFRRRITRNRDPRLAFRPASLAILIACFLLPIAPLSSAEYRGNVGKMEAVFQIEFGDNGAVGGTYYYPDRPGVVYRLTGTNPESGHIILREFTGDRETARCDLWKTLTDTEIVWSGRMYNADGREFPMRFARARDPGAASRAMPALPEFEDDFEPDRTLHAERVAPILGKPGELEAHLYGNLYYGWIRENGLPPVETLEELLAALRDEGGLIWAAMRFADDRVEVQFEETNGQREILQGTNPAEGRIELRDEAGNPWSGRKLVTEKAIYWILSSRADSPRGLMIYRPRDERYFSMYEEMRNLAPEAFVWEYNEWGNDFFEQRFPYDSEEERGVMVSSVREEAGTVSAVTLAFENGETETLILDPPRDRNRVPVAEGYSVSVYRSGGRISEVVVELNPISWRKRGDHVLELLLFHSPQVEAKENDLGEFYYPEEEVEKVTKVAVVPDFAIVTNDIFATWRIEEDMITWGVGDRGPGMLELESLSLDDAPPPVADVGPWRSIAEPIDIITNQLRIVNMSTTSGFSYVLPGNEP